MKHYICTGGCGGVSETPGVCKTSDCPDEGNSLEACDCEDGNHKSGDEASANEAKP